MGILRRIELTGYHLIGGEYVDGIWVEGTLTPFTFITSVQPLKGSELQMLPEGRRDSTSYTLFTDTKLRKLKEENPDIVIIDDEQLEVFKRENWQNGIINHYECIVVKLDKEKKLPIP